MEKLFKLLSKGVMKENGSRPALSGAQHIAKREAPTGSQSRELIQLNSA
jgi:hypothetical protein